jgi:hypothetical protein
MTVTLPKLSGEKRANLYERANACRRANDYDRAMGIYETILSEDLTDAEAYWSIVLCKYGIEYVEDPKNRKRIPTCNRTRTVSVFDDHDYRQAIVYASGEAKAFYEEEAAMIDAIQKSILDISNREAPFDVFICYKETDGRGRRTPDSVVAQELYDELAGKGYKVFFARITLEDKLGEVYEPYIFAALNSARVMVVVGSRREYFDSVWVKNEWSRYIALIRDGAKKTLIPAYKDMDAGDLPEEFVHLQALNMNNLGFMQDLVRGIEKIVPKKKTVPDVSPFWTGIQGEVWRGTELIIDENSKTVLGIAGTPGNHIVIPPEITSIAPKAFMNIDEIISLVIEDGKLKSIPEYAFAGCKNLKTVIFSDKITSVGNSAFEDCEALECVNFPFSLKTIGDRAFAKCGFRDNLYFPEKFRSVGSESFANCNKLQTVTVDGLETMGERSFAGCIKLTEVYFTNNNMSNVSRSAFADCTALQEVMIDGRCKTVEEAAFAGCSSLRKLDFGDGLRTVKKNAFAGCAKLKSVIFPDNFENIAEGAFSGCAMLEHITVPGKISVAPGAFEGCAKIKRINIAGKVLKSLLWLAPFSGNEAIRITISGDIELIGEGAFRGCEFLRSTKIPNSAREIGKNAFAGLAGITKITVPNNVVVIGESAFEGCTELKEITFDRSFRLQTVGNRAFAGCTKLVKIEIPDTVQSVGADVFAGCDNLKVIYIPESGTTGKLYKKKKITINHPAVTFSREDVVRVEKSVHTTITVSPKAKSIAERAFRFYSGVKSVAIPDMVEYIGEEAFEGCSGIESIVFPEKVKTIAGRAFADCTGLAALVVPDTVEKICEEAFCGCTGIRELVVPVKVLSGAGIFTGCSGLKKITFSGKPVSVTDIIRIPDSTFMGCTALESITLPAGGVVFLGNEAFAECSSLKDVTLPDSAKFYEHNDMSDAFKNTPFLKRYKLEQERHSKGLCIYCGGKLSFFKRKCKECGKIKD